MGIGTSIFLIAIGAILRYGVANAITGIDLAVIGLILMIVGVIGLLVSIFVSSNIGGRRETSRETVVVRDEPIDPLV